MQMFSSKKRKNVIPDALFESVLHVSVQIVLIGIAAVIFAQLGVHCTLYSLLMLPLSNALLNDCV